MAVTMGFTASLADVVVLDEFFDQIETGSSGSSSPFQTASTQNVVSSYVFVDVPGDIVYENQLGELQFINEAPAGFVPISATRIVSNGNVRGVPKSTTAGIMSWMGAPKY